MSRVTGESTTSLSSAAGRFDIAIMNAIGFDASALGNHEFDFGQDQLLAVVAAGDDWTGAFFPYLTANLVFEDESVLRAVYDADGVAPGENARGVIAPFAIIEDNGERFGVIGATTQLVTSISSTFGDPDNPNDDVEAHGTIDMAVLAGRIQPVIDALEADGVDRIILTSHLQQFSLEVELGRAARRRRHHHRRRIRHAPRRRGRQAAQARRGCRGLPLPDRGRGRQPRRHRREPTGSTPTSAASWWTSTRTATSCRRASTPPSRAPSRPTRRASLAVTGAADLDGAIASSTKGSAVRDLVNVVQTAVLETSGNTFFARQAVDLNGERNPGVRSEETNLGNLTADANLVTARSLSGGDVHVSIKNGGGIRASIPTGDGFVSELEIQQTLAFNNTLTLLTLTPAQLYETLSYAVSGNAYDADGNATDVSGRFPQVGGLRFSFDPSLPAEEQVRDIVLVGAGADGGDVKIYDDGAPTDAAAALTDGIRVVTLSFMAGGGDGYPFPAFVAADSGFADVVDLHQPDVIADGAAQFTNVGSEQDALAEYLAENFPVDGDAAIDLADTPAADDTRIVNLGVPGASDL